MGEIAFARFAGSAYPHTSNVMADGVRFELTVDLRPRQFSRLEP